MSWHTPLLVDSKHWRRLVKNIGGANQNNGEKKVITDTGMGVSEILEGARARAPPQSLHL